MSRVTCDLATAFPDKWAALTPGEHTIQIRAKNPGNYLDSDLSTAITFVKVVNYTITANLTNCAGVASNPTTIASNTTGTMLTFTANTGYDLPASVTVTGATSSWNQSTGELTLTKPTGNVAITIAATAKTYNITVNATNATAASTNPTTIVYGAGAQLKFTFPDGYYAPTAVTVSGATQIWDAGTGALTLSNCTGPVTVTIEGATKTYSITPTLTNCTWDTENATTIASNQFTPIQLIINKNTGWTLPTEISVSGVNAEYWSWNQSTGIVTISHPQGNVTVTVNAVREVYNITTNLTHALAGSGNPTTIGYGLNATLTFTFPTGYEAPADVTVTGATKSWEAGTGTLTLTNATGPVTVTVVGVATTTTIDGGTYKWLDNAALTEWAQEINFTSNGASYSGMRYTGNGTAMTLQYMNADSEWQTVYNYDEDASTGSWVNTAWQIVDLGTSAQTVTAIFKADFVTNTTKLTQLSTPQNVTADGTVVSWDEVENAEKYEIFADGISIGTVGKLATPQNVTADGTVVSWDAVENAYYYRILINGIVRNEVYTNQVNLRDCAIWSYLYSGTYDITIVAVDSKENESDPSIPVQVTKITKALEEASWDDISQVSANKQWDVYGWRVGDTKTITLNGTVGSVSLNNYQCKVTIMEFDHNAKLEGEGITFGLLESMNAPIYDPKGLCLVDDDYDMSASATAFTMNPDFSNVGGWKDSHMRSQILGSIDKQTPVDNSLMSVIPNDLRAVLKPITKYTNNVGKSNETSAITSTIDYLPLMSPFEVFNYDMVDIRYINSHESEYQTQYVFFLDDTEILMQLPRIKYKHTNEDTIAKWWLRSPDTGSEARYWYADKDIPGSLYQTESDISLGLSPIFLV